MESATPQAPPKPKPRIRKIEILGLHGQQKLSASFRDRLNIVHGKNGSGKTTLLHVIANLLEKDIERFCHISFSHVILTTADGSIISLHQQRTPQGRPVTVVLDDTLLAIVNPGDQTPPAVTAALEQRLGGRPVYLPAFRTMLEGSDVRRGYRGREIEEYRKEFDLIRQREIHSMRRRLMRFHFSDPSESIAAKTVICRHWFGPFVPIVRYPSLADVTQDLTAEFHSAFFDLSNFDQNALSSVFVNVLQATLTQVPQAQTLTLDQTLERLKVTLARLKDTYASAPDAYLQIAQFLERPLPPHHANEESIKQILVVYANAVEERVQAQNRAFSTIKTFEQSVNRFLDRKQLAITKVRNSPANNEELIQLEDGRTYPLTVLSSGERHVLTLLFCATHMAETDGVVLIDKPELSLHVDWQRIILQELMNQAGDRQIVVCTHATEVAADHRDCLVPLESEQWTEQQASLFQSSELISDESADEQ